VQDLPDSRSVRWYRRLTRLYPAPFRHEYETEMVALVRDRQAERSDARALVTLWAELLVDLCTTAPREHARMLIDDLRHAARVLRTTPALTGPVVLVLAVGIGATTAVFTLANGVLLRPLPFVAPDRLVLLDESAPARGIPSMGTNFPNLRDYQRESRSLQQIGAYFEGGFTLTGGGEPERVDGAWVSWNLFDLLGVQPVLGRTFRREEDGPKIETAVILSHGLWQRRYGGDPGIVGRTIPVGGTPRTVVGVMPQGFRFPERGELWAPMSLDPAANTRTDYFLTAIARLKDGLTLAQASAEVQAVFAGIRRKYPEAATGVELSVLPLRDRLTADYSAVLVRLLVAVLLVLTIACTNVMNLLLARAAGRQREFAIRAALGANRRRVVRQLLTEALLLGAIGGVLGVVLGAAIIPALLRSSPVEIPYWISLQPDWRVIGFTTLVVVGASVFFGLAPALHATRVDLTSAVKQVGAGGAARPASRIRQGLVVAQLALSVVLLVGAGLMVRSLANLAKVDLGFRSDDVLTFQVALPNTRYAESSDRIQFFRRLMQELQARPQVRAAGATAGLPLGDNWWRTFLREGETRTRLADLTPVRYVPVTGAYFAAMGIPVISGRAFTDTEGAASAPIIVSRNTAARFWPGQDAIGRRVMIDSFIPGQPWRTIVGVVGDVRSGSPREEAPLTVYVPHASEALSAMTVAIRGRTAMSALITDARAVVRRLDRELPLAAVRPMRVVVERANWDFRLYTQLFVLFAAIAILLAAVGLGGIMTHLVTERTREIGVRMALGAAPRQVLVMVLGSAATLVAVGLGIGIVGALVLTRSLSSLLFGVAPEDATTMASVLAVLTAVALLASWLPARNAARVSPIDALRTE
jgi:putative ABC transport system permease protein